MIRDHVGRLLTIIGLVVVSAGTIQRAVGQRAAHRTLAAVMILADPPSAIPEDVRAVVDWLIGESTLGPRWLSLAMGGAELLVLAVVLVVFFAPRRSKSDDHWLTPAPESRAGTPEATERSDVGPP